MNMLTQTETIDIFEYEKCLNPYLRDTDAVLYMDRTADRTVLAVRTTGRL